VTVVYVPAIAA